MKATKTEELRLLKSNAQERVSAFGIQIETKLFWEGGIGYNFDADLIIEAALARDITFDDLDGISKTFDTKNINFTKGDQTYYGSWNSAKLRIAIKRSNVDSWFLSVSESRKTEADRAKKASENDIRRLQDLAHSLGYSIDKKK